MTTFNTINSRPFDYYEEYVSNGSTLTNLDNQSFSMNVVTPTLLVQRSFETYVVIQPTDQTSSTRWTLWITGLSKQTLDKLLENGVGAVRTQLPYTGHPGYSTDKTTYFSFPLEPSVLGSLGEIANTYKAGPTGYALEIHALPSGEKIRFTVNQAIPAT